VSPCRREVRFDPGRDVRDGCRSGLRQRCSEPAQRREVQAGGRYRHSDQATAPTSTLSPDGKSFGHMGIMAWARRSSAAVLRPWRMRRPWSVWPVPGGRYSAVEWAVWGRSRWSSCGRRCPRTSWRWCVSGGPQCEWAYLMTVGENGSGKLIWLAREVGEIGEQYSHDTGHAAATPLRYRG